MVSCVYIFLDHYKFEECVLNMSRRTQTETEKERRCQTCGKKYEARVKRNELTVMY